MREVSRERERRDVDREPDEAVRALGPVAEFEVNEHVDGPQSESRAQQYEENHERRMSAPFHSELGRSVCFMERERQRDRFRIFQFYEYDSDVESVKPIEVRPEIRSGKPIFAGTRITVYDVLDYLASGMAVEDIVSDFPELTEDNVLAAIKFAANRERRLTTPV